MRLIAKEFRGYLEALEIKDDVHDLLTSYSVEVNASFRLKPVRKSSTKNSKDHDQDAEESSEES